MSRNDFRVVPCSFCECEYSKISMTGSFVPHLRGTPKLRWYTCKHCAEIYDVPSIMFEDEWQSFQDKIAAQKTFDALQQEVHR